MELSGEQLNRKWHELSGWRYVKNYGGSHLQLLLSPQAVAGIHEDYLSPSPFPDLKIMDKSPRLHTDANLAIAELLKVATEGWSLGPVNEDAACQIEGPHFNCMIQRGESPEWPEGCGATVCEAILKALIASKEIK